MHTRFLSRLTVSALIVLGGTSNVLAISGIPTTVQEAPSGGGTTQYTVKNQSSSMTTGGKFDISIFLSTTTGGTPTTTNSGWTAESVDADSWTDNMPGETITWNQYTGLSYMQAFPANPLRGVNGYFLDFTFNSDTDTISFPGAPVIPGSSLGGFFFSGSPSSTFLVDGPTDSTGTGTTSFTWGTADQASYNGTSTDVPEPASLGLAAIALGGLAFRRRRLVA